MEDCSIGEVPQHILRFSYPHQSWFHLAFTDSNYIPVYVLQIMMGFYLNKPTHDVH